MGNIVDNCKPYLAHKAVAGLSERHDGRSGTATLRVGDNRRLATLHCGNRRVGGAQINSNHLNNSSGAR